MSFNYYRNRVLKKGSTSQDRILNEKKRSFEEYLKVAPSVYDFMVNDVGVKGSVQDVKFNDPMKDDKYLLTHMDLPIDIGNYINWKDKTYLVLSKEDETVEDHQSYRLSPTNKNLKWIDKDGNLVEKPAITTSQTLYTTGIKVEKTIEIPDGMQGIQLPYDKDTKQLDIKDCFVFNKTKYEISHYDETTYPGILVLVCREISLSDNDDQINEIADRWIDAQGGGKIDRLPWLDNQEPPEETEPTEPQEPILGIAYEIIGQPEFPSDPDDEIWYNSWTIYTVNKFIDDVEVVGNFTFELSDTKATLSDITSNSCKVNVGSVSGDHNIKLIATDIDTSQIAIEKEITIKGR